MFTRFFGLFLVMVVMVVSTTRAQTGGTFSPVSTLPLDATSANLVAGATLTKDRAAITRTSGDIAVVDKSGKITATLTVAAIPQGVVYYKYPPGQGGILENIHVTGWIGLQAGSDKIFVETLCPTEPAGARSFCQLYAWDIKTSKLTRLFGREDRVLTNQGYMSLRFTTLSGIAPDGSLLIITNNKLVRRTETANGPTYIVAYTPPFSLGLCGAMIYRDKLYVAECPMSSLGAPTSLSVLNLNDGNKTMLLSDLANGFWVPSVDQTRDEVVATTFMLPQYRFSSHQAYRLLDPGPAEQLLATTSAWPMVSNGLRFYHGLDSPWDRRSYPAHWDALYVRDEAGKTWVRVLSIGDKMPDGKTITGIKPVTIPYDTHSFVLTNEGWYRFDPSFNPPPPPPPPPQAILPTISLVGNAAKWSVGVSPGSLATIRGANLYEAGKETVVTFDGHKAPVLYASAEQLNVQVPQELGAPAEVRLKISRNGTPSADKLLPLLPLAPAFFTARDDFVIIVEAETGGVLDPLEPLQVGKYYTTFLTGLGPVSPQPPTGQAAAAASPTTNLVRFFVDGPHEANILYSGLAPGFVGLYQVNFQMPDTGGDGMGGSPRRTVVSLSVEGESTSGGITIMSRPQ